MIKLAIFDLDGTLLNTMEDLGTACNHALAMCGFPERKMKEYNTLVGRGIYNLFSGALPEGKATDENILRMKELFIPYYDEHKCDKTLPYPGTIEMLDTVSSAGISLAIASNKYQDGTEKLVNRFFGQYSFVKVLGQRDGMPIKPSPEIVYEAMDMIEGISKDEVVYIGDSDVDMQTGLNAGVKTIGVTWGFRSKEELEAYRPWGLADSREQLSSMLVALNLI